MKLSTPKLSTPVLRVLAPLFAMFLLLGIIAQANAQNPTTVNTDTNKIYKEVPPAEAQLAFIDQLHSRSDLVNGLKEIDPGFVFKQDKEVNGMPVYSATNNYNASVEIIGNDNDLKTAKWTFGISPDKAANSEGFYRMARFTQLMEGEQGVLWLTQKAKENVKGHPSDDFTETKEFIKGRVVTFDYRPKLSLASITIAFKKE